MRYELTKKDADMSFFDVHIVHFPLNVNKYFVRDGKTQNGWYKRAGKSFPVDGRWRGSDIFAGDSLFPLIYEHNMSEFVGFLKRNKWYNNRGFHYPRKISLLKNSNVNPMAYEKFLFPSGKWFRHVLFRGVL